MTRALASTALCLFACSNGSRVAAQPAPPVSATLPSRASTSSSAFVGYYALARPGADAMQALTLRLRGDGIATLRVATPGYTQTAAGIPATPAYETGTWIEKDGKVTVHFDMTSNVVDGVPTDLRRESVDLAFALNGCVLKLIGDPGKVYGADGLTFAKQQCAA